MSDLDNILDKKLNLIAQELFEIEAIKFGEFKLKSGILSPIYIDLRVIISYPKLLKQISDLFYQKLQNLDYDCICGVPYTALPIACALSINYDIPMLIRRKEAKDYGTKKIIEGVFKKLDKCLIIEDLITSGISILETTNSLKKEGLQVNDAIVLIDRQQGGFMNMQKNNIKVHSVFSLENLLNSLVMIKKITLEQKKEVMSFINSNQVSA